MEKIIVTVFNGRCIIRDPNDSSKKAIYTPVRGYDINNRYTEEYSRRTKQRRKKEMSRLLKKIEGEQDGKQHMQKSI